MMFVRNILQATTRTNLLRVPSITSYTQQQQPHLITNNSNNNNNINNLQSSKRFVQVEYQFHDPNDGERSRSENELRKKYGLEKVKITDSYDEQYSKHRKLVQLGEEKIPKVLQDTYVAPCATIVGNVELWNNSSVWYRAVIRGDKELVRIGANTNIQDGSVITSTNELGVDHDGSTIIGSNCTIGHNCYLSGCTIESNCHVGMNSVLEEGAYLESYVMLGAATTVPKHFRIPSGQLWVGSPARYVRDLTVEEREFITDAATHYHTNAELHDAEFCESPTDIVLDAEKHNIQLGWNENTYQEAK